MIITIDSRHAITCLRFAPQIRGGFNVSSGEEGRDKKRFEGDVKAGYLMEIEGAAN